MQDLTVKQKQVLEVISYYIHMNGYPPTQREIARLLKVKYVNSIFNIVCILEKKRYIKTDYGKARAITLLKDIDDELNE